MRRENMIKKREAKGLTIKQMARKCCCSPLLLQKLENGDWITHPRIAARIAAAYGMGVRAYNEIVHSSHKAKQLPAPTPLPDAEYWYKHIKSMRKKESQT